MRRETKYITNIEIEMDLNKTSQQDKECAFEKFKQDHPNAYDPKSEYVIIYDDSCDKYSIYELQ